MVTFNLSKLIDQKFIATKIIAHLGHAFIEFSFNMQVCIIITITLGPAYNSVLIKLT